MITIFSPIKYQKGQMSYLSATIEDGNNNKSFDIYFRVPYNYGDYLVNEVSDTFVLLSLLYAIASEQDILVKHPISQGLEYILNNSLIFLLSKIFRPKSTKIIKVFLDQPSIIDTYSNSSYANACGCSLGIDSLSAIKYLSSEDCPQSMRLTHLTYFNIGALGEYDIKLAEQTFIKNADSVKQYADNLSLPLVLLESNSSIIFTNYYSFEQTHSIRNICAVIAMKKLFRNYFYASSYSIDHIELNQNSMSYYDGLLLPLLSYDNLHFHLADSGLSRTEKTQFVAQDPLVQKHLYVCWKDISSNGNKKYADYISNINSINCTRCDKCLRTAFTLDVLGVLDKYDSVFDLSYYYIVREAYIIKIFDNKENNVFSKEIANLIESTHYHIPKKTKLKIWLKRRNLLFIYPILWKGYRAFSMLCFKSSKITNNQLMQLFYLLLYYSLARFLPKSTFPLLGNW